MHDPKNNEKQQQSLSKMLKRASVMGRSLPSPPPPHPPHEQCCIRINFGKDRASMCLALPALIQHGGGG